MKRLLPLIVLFGLPSALAFHIVGRSGVATVAAGGGQAFSDDFNRADNDSLGANWTEHVGDQDIVSSNLSHRTNSFGENKVIYSGQACDGVDQYCRVTMNPIGRYTGVVFRFTDASSPVYRMRWHVSEEQISWVYQNLGASPTITVTIQTIASVVSSDGQTWGITVDGESDSTVVRWWLNPGSTTPSAADNWDGAADYTMSDNPLSTNRVNTGTYIGFDAFHSQAGDCDMDDFYGGDIP